MHFDGENRYRVQAWSGSRDPVVFAATYVLIE